MTKLIFCVASWAPNVAFVLMILKRMFTNTHQNFCNFLKTFCKKTAKKSKAENFGSFQQNVLKKLKNTALILVRAVT